MSSWFERRRNRGRQRRRFEEVAAWIVLPSIVLLCWFIGKEVYTAYPEPIDLLVQIAKGYL